MLLLHDTNDASNETLPARAAKLRHPEKLHSVHDQSAHEHVPVEEVVSVEGRQVEKREHVPQKVDEPGVDRQERRKYGADLV